MTFAFERFGAIDQDVARELAQDHAVKPLYLRVMFAALGWSNLAGHAEFSSPKHPDLDHVLASRDVIPSRRQVNAAISRAVEMRLIHPESSRLCLRAPEWWHKAGGRDGYWCNHHGIKKPSAGRDKRSPATPAKRDKRSPAPGQEKSRDDALTCANVKPLYDSVLPPSHPLRRTA